MCGFITGLHGGEGWHAYFMPLGVRGRAKVLELLQALQPPALGSSWLGWAPAGALRRVAQGKCSADKAQRQGMDALRRAGGGEIMKPLGFLLRKEHILHPTYHSIPLYPPFVLPGSPGGSKPAENPKHLATSQPPLRTPAWLDSGANPKAFHPKPSSLCLKTKLCILPRGQGAAGAVPPWQAAGFGIISPWIGFSGAERAARPPVICSLGVLG